MSIKKIIKGSLISLAVLSMVGGSMNSTIANAKHRHAHYTRRIKRARRHSKRSRLYRHHGKIRYSYKRIRHARKHYIRRSRKHYAKRRYAKRITNHRHGKYFWGLITGDDGSLNPERVQIINNSNPNNPLVRIVNNRAAKKFGRETNIASNSLYSSRSHANRDANEWNANNDTSSNSNTSIPTQQPQHKQKSYSDNPAADQEVSKDELNLITQDRAEHNKAPLQESPELDQIAQKRAEQTYKGNLMSTSDPHMDQATGKPYDDEVAQSLGYNDVVGTMGENLAGGIDRSSAEQSAKEANNMLYTNEEATDGGHYQNIIGEYYQNPQVCDENYQSVGVGTYGNILAEDFSLK